VISLLKSARRPLIMGIVNVTPDSFSGDGVLGAEDYVVAAVAAAAEMLRDGADILDIGGESSRPGSAPVGAAEEIRRVVPVIAALRRKLGAAPVLAVDTVKADVAEAALKAGADLVNDITALRHDPAMAATVARHGCPVVLMHNAARAEDVRHDAKIGGSYGAAGGGDVVEKVRGDLLQAVAAARAAGIADDRIILDPGLGFGKSAAQNLDLIRHIGRIRDLGFPVLVGPSRKSFIGKALDLPVDERLEGTAAVVALAAFSGADIIRVHDVKFMARVARMAAAIKGS
jgi:dihydropteroate synthase